MIRDFTAILSAKKNLTGQVWQFDFQIEGEPLVFTAGQYVLLKINDAFRQCSISSSPTDGSHIQFIIEFFPGGLASTYLDALAVGESAGFKGPAGVFTLRESSRPKIFLATGTGIAPVASMIKSALSSNHTEKLYVLFGLKTRDDIYLYEEFKALAQAHANFDFDICLSREENLDGLDPDHVAMGRVNHVLDVYFDESGEDRNDFEYYLCGNNDIVLSLKEYCVSSGIAKEQIYFEIFK